jgi:GNAT superfamily N-acetyltransferase
MTAWTITPVPVAPDLDHPDAWGVHGAAAVSAALDLDRWGHTDTARTAQAVLTGVREQTYVRRVRLVATAADAPRAADTVVGLGSADLPLVGNTHYAELDVTVHPDLRDSGLADTLLEAVEAAALEEGRTTLVLATEHPGEPAADDPTALAAPTGSGRISASASEARLALRHGYELGQAERYSVLDLPVDPALLGRLHVDAAAHAEPDYRLVSWSDRAPDEWIDGLALLETRMSTDAPMGELDIREEAWDAARIRDAEARRAMAGYGFRVVAAVHVASGTLAGHTMVEYPLAKPGVAFQGDTIVLREHRGHRLGMLLKATMLRELAVARPQAERVHTWNAEENDHMLGINVALGFRRAGVVGLWQKTVG